MATKQQLEDKLARDDCSRKERELSNQLYAIKLVEKIVFGLVGLILTAVVGALVALILK